MSHTIIHRAGLITFILLYFLSLCFFSFWPKKPYGSRYESKDEILTAIDVISLNNKASDFCLWGL